jgi:hypothetical protein
MQDTHAQLTHTSSYQFLPCPSCWRRQPTSQQPRRRCICAGTRILVKLHWGYMWSYRWLKVKDKEVLAPRLQRKQVEKSFNGGSMLVLGKTVLETRAWTQRLSQSTTAEIKRKTHKAPFLLLLVFFSFPFSFFLLQLFFDIFFQGNFKIEYQDQTKCF